LKTGGVELVAESTSVVQPALAGEYQVRGCGQTRVGRNIKRVVITETLFYGTGFGARWDEDVRGKNEV